MSGSNLKVSNPYPRPCWATFPWKPRPPPLAIFANAVFFEQRVREDLWLSATCAVVGNGERRSLTLKSWRGLSFRLHIWRHPDVGDGSYYGTSTPNVRSFLRG